MNLKFRIIIIILLTDRPTGTNFHDCPYNKKISCLYNKLVSLTKQEQFLAIAGGYCSSYFVTPFVYRNWMSFQRQEQISLFPLFL